MNRSISSSFETREQNREHKGFKLSKLNLHEGAHVVIVKIYFFLSFRRSFILFQLQKQHT
jgi:hypothetical protein